MREGIDRRAFLGLSARAALLGATGGLAGCGDDPAPFVEASGWRAGEVVHLLPTAGADRIALHASFARAPRAPRLAVDGAAAAPGVRTDTDGRCFRFDVEGLAPAREHALSLHEADGAPLCDAWPLRTLPAPDARPERLRLLAWTCAGGPEGFRDLRLRQAFRPLAVRRRLLARALSFAPDVVIANGDHVYWDLHSRYGLGMGRSPQAWWRAGLFDREAPLRGGANEAVLKAAFGPQLAGLYGTLLRSVPTWFLQDDHDYTENDHASDARRTFPPDAFMRAAARATQRLYYPDLLPAAGVPAPPAAGGSVAGCGALRFGRLFEALLYDCRGALANAADPATGDRDSWLVPPGVERWLVERSLRSDALHLMHVPSTPVLWTAGKWGEWYPDVRDAEGRLGTAAPKPWWPPGWQAQHDRLLAAASRRRDRTPLFASGDLHALATGRILRSGALDLSANPVVSVLCGPVGTGEAGWPSAFRGTRPRPSAALEAEEWTAPVEENGFTLFDVTPDALRIAQFRWHPAQGVDAIAGLEPFVVREIRRPGA